MISYRFIGENLGIAIIVLAVISRIVTIPLTNRQLKMAKKSKEFQSQYEKIKKQHAKNKDKQTQELSKLQMKYLPGQLAGCLPLIIMLVFLIQVRNSIKNLVVQGVYAYNKVAYIKSLTYPEDSARYTPSEDLSVGDHTLKVYVESSGGNTFEKEIKFAIVENEDQQKQRDKEIKTEVSKNASKTSEEIGIYVASFEKHYALLERKPELLVLFRPPSGQTLVTEKIKLELDGSDITQSSALTSGVGINLRFLGMNLSKTAADFSWKDINTILPYVLLALFVGISQYFSTKMMTGIKNVKDSKKKKEVKQKELTKKDKEKKKETKEPNMEDMMKMMGGQMNFLFPILTIVTSLGYWGGSNIFPAGISLFWTVQTIFVIIQQVIDNKNEVFQWVEHNLNRK